MTAPPVDVHAYYRQITDVDIGEIARELLGSSITQESRQTLVCDCPNHRSQSHGSRDLCPNPTARRGTSWRRASGYRLGRRPFRAARRRLKKPTGSRCVSGRPLTALAELYYKRLAGNSEVLAWFRSKYGIGEETIGRLKIGYADNGGPSVARALMEGPSVFTPRELTATSAFRPTAQDGLVPFSDSRIVFPYWSRGHVAFMIGRRTPWTPDVEWEKSKYKKLAVRNDRDHRHGAPCVRNDVLYNEDAFLTRPERVIITEGVTDCISTWSTDSPWCRR